MGFESLFGFGEQAPPGSSVSHQSFFERMGNAICGVFCGIVLFLAGLYFVYWNEGRAVHESCAIFEASKLVSEASCVKSSSFDNTLVHVGCPINQTSSVKPFYFHPLNITTHGMVFKGSLQQYQIHESKSSKTKKNSVGGGTTTITTYSYSKRWSSSAPSSFSNAGRDSPSYMGENCPSFPSIATPGGKVSPIYMGTGYHLSEVMESTAAGPAVATPPTGLPKFVDTNKWDPIHQTGSCPTMIVNGGTNGTSNFRYASGEYVTYQSSPKVGDLKIVYSVAQPVSDFTVMAKQLPDGSFASEKFEKCSNYGFYKYQAGTVSADDLVNQANSTNKIMTYLLRFVAFMALWCGLQLCVGPIALVPDLIPCIGPYIGDLVGCLLMCATCLVATCFFCFVFAISWIYFRPMIGIPMFIIACLSGGGLVYWRVKKKKELDTTTYAEF